jgi:hypothetical protein
LETDKGRHGVIIGHDIDTSFNIIKLLSIHLTDRREEAQSVPLKNPATTLMHPLLYDLSAQNTKTRCFEMTL